MCMLKTDSAPLMHACADAGTARSRDVQAAASALRYSPAPVRLRGAARGRLADLSKKSGGCGDNSDDGADLVTRACWGQGNVPARMGLANRSQKVRSARQLLVVCLVRSQPVLVVRLV